MKEININCEKIKKYINESIKDKLLDDNYEYIGKYIDDEMAKWFKKNRKLIQDLIDKEIKKDLNKTIKDMVNNYKKGLYIDHNDY